MSDLNQISKELSVLEPFGKGIEKPKFCFKRLRVADLSRTNSGNIRAILFNANSKNDILDQLDKNSDGLLDIVGTVNCHEQFGSSVVIEDIRKSE